MDREPEERKLGSLAQSARMTNLNAAMGILIFIGVLLIAFHTYELVTARDQLNAELRKQGLVVLDQQQFEQVLMIVRVIVGGAVALGVIFVILGLLVKKFPVPVTIAGLVLFLLYQLVIIVLDPANLARGIIIKIFIIAGLIKAIGAALAYQSETARIREELEYER